MMDVSQITQLHRDMVSRWHEQEVDNPYEGFLATVCRQFQDNFLLWHEEDIARSREVGDAKIAEVKRAIDGYNQSRNDWIEKIDDYLTEQLQEQGIVAPEDAPLNTETPGSVIDRLSILALRTYHMEEQSEREGATPEHLASVKQKLALCHIQHADLSQSLQELLNDIFAGRKQHRTYRQMKMYNDPNLNPCLQ